MRGAEDAEEKGAEDAEGGGSEALFLRAVHKAV